MSYGRFVDGSVIRRRMNQKDARVNRAVRARMEPELIHLVDIDSYVEACRQRDPFVRTVCGARVEREHGLRLAPTCPTCVDIDRQHERQLEQLLTEQGGL